jgi:pimeloyl-[acyl-carrier protein] methyl ester esterase
MSLHIESQGSGKPLLLIHGWGMHSGMWGSVAEKMALSHRVHRVDLPGYGASSSCNPYDLDTLVQQLSSQFTAALTVVGWSLGGQLALRWAQLHPEQVKKLVLVATTPCFVQKENWRCAMAAETLGEFATALLQNHAQLLRRFLALQVRGSENEKQILTEMRAQLFSKGEPDGAALKGGLEILRDTDLRAQLANIKQSTLVIAGERDTLTPREAASAMVKSMPDARVEIIPGAAHAPFMSHPEIFVQHLRNFINE